VPVTLEDFVEFVFQTPEGCPAAREFGLLVEPLVARAQQEKPPDFIRVRRERFGNAVQALPPDATAARDVLSRILARSPSVPPRPAVPEGEWEEKVGKPLWQVPGDLGFLRRLPTHRDPCVTFGRDGEQRSFTGKATEGQGNSAAVSMAISFVRGDRKGVRKAWAPPPGPGP
jgi:hypothetical protein